MKYFIFSSFFYFLLALTSCKPEEIVPVIPGEEISMLIAERFAGNIDLANVANYENQELPDYITADNSFTNPITDEGATLGRVLFYDVQLSSDRSVSCASCHIQELAFGDDKAVSEGVNGFTGRHSMRLVNARFSNGLRFFWDRRADNLEEQTTMPIQDHIEMGFSGEQGDEDISDLINRLEEDEVYPHLFAFAFGTPIITEERMQEALAQFIRSIQSFDSKYDEGRVLVNNHNQPFPNFTEAENNGKNLFSMPAQFNIQNQRIGGGLGCRGCHNAPEFDINPNSRNNGVIHSAQGDEMEFLITRSPSLRNIFDIDGNELGPFMHTGDMSISDVIDHYNDINAEGNSNLDARLRGGPNGNGQKLNMSDNEKAELIAFLRTLSGASYSTDTRWSDPWDR